MQLIAVDIGNSAIKVSVHDDIKSARWCDQYQFRDDEAFQLDLPSLPAFWCICSVNNRRWQQLEKWIATRRPHDHVRKLTPEDVPLPSRVVSRRQTGVDRLLGAWMATRLCEQGPVVLVDAGTAVTVDFVDMEGVFAGGVIFPGASTALKQLSSATDALPDLSAPEHLKRLGDLNRHAVGTDTESAILIGVYQAQIAAMTHSVDRILATVPARCPVYATGGGVMLLERYLPNNWKVVPDLVLRGAQELGCQLASETGVLPPTPESTQ